MPHFVRSYISKALTHYIIGENLRAYSRIHGPRLHQTPIVYQAYHVVIPDNLSRNNLSRAWIYIARPHGILNGCCGITECIVASIVGVEGRIGGIIECLDGIFEARSLKSCIPILYSLLNGRAPLLGESIVHIKDDGLYGFNEFSTLIGGCIFGFEAPTMDEAEALYLVFVRSKKTTR